MGYLNKLNEEITLRTKLAFATGEIGDNLAYQSFSFLVFTFYFTYVQLEVTWITGGFIIWSLWNSINDPLLGWLSDRTKSKLGRRILRYQGAVEVIADLKRLQADLGSGSGAGTQGA